MVKKLFLAFLVLVALFGITMLEQWFLMTPTARAQTNTFCAANLACIVTAAWTFGNINNTLYVSQFAGADLGAKMNAAVTNCTVTLALPNCKYIIDVGGTVSTAPNFPIGSTVECTATAFIQLATTWTIAHRNSFYNLSGCQFYYNQDASAAAIVVGKNANTISTVNCVGAGPSTCTFVSGTNFTNIDVCDLVSINGGNFNVTSVTPPNTLVVAGATGTVNGVPFAGNISPPNCGGYPSSVTVRDLDLVYNGAGTTTSIGLQVVRTFNANIINPHITGFTGAQSEAFQSNGMLYTLVSTPWFYNNRCQMILDQSLTGGVTITSNSNKFSVPVVQAGPVCASGFSINVVGGVENLFDQPDVESNLSTTAVGLGGARNTLKDGFFQLNGDNTANSSDIKVTAGFGNVIEQNEFTSLALNQPATGIICTGASTSCILRANVWGPINNFYTTAWNFVSGATGILEGNSPGTSAHGEPLFGSYRLNAPVSPIDAPFKTLGVSDTTGLVGAFFDSKVSGRGVCTEYGDDATFSFGLCADGATGDLVYKDGTFPGTAGTERWRLKRGTGTLQLGVAAQGDLGTTLLPWGNLWLGTAATNNFKLQPAATAAARVISMPDPLGAVNMPYVIASGTSTLTTTSTATLTCQTTVTTAAANALTTDSIEIAYSSAPTAATDGLMIVQKWVTAGNVNFMRCNPTAGTLVPTALVINWRVIR